MKFVCDAMLGKLAKHLRILGLDAPYADRGPAGTVPDEPFCFLTRRKAASAAGTTVFIRSDRVREQLREVLPVIKPYVAPQKFMTRCLLCNLPLAEIPRSEVEARVPEYVFHRYEVFRVCPSCGRIYWGGTHTARMSWLIKEVLGDVGAP